MKKPPLFKESLWSAAQEANGETQKVLVAVAAFQSGVSIFGGKTDFEMEVAQKSL